MPGCAEDSRRARNGTGSLPPRRVKLPGLEHADQQPLHAGRQILDLVNEQRAVAGLLEQAPVTLPSAFSRPNRRASASASRRLLAMSATNGAAARGPCSCR